LKKALSQRREIEDAGGEDTVEGKKVAERYSWDAALARAGGEKVLDDPKLLQKSVKNELRQKKKSQEKWQERNNRTTEQMAAKQKKRKDSLKGRADAKVEKRIEKREKKRNRPGFEGRSQAPINK
jgi:exonuclease VII large subunit